MLSIAKLNHAHRPVLQRSWKLRLCFTIQPILLSCLKFNLEKNVAQKTASVESKLGDKFVIESDSRCSVSDNLHTATPVNVKLA
ncbi:hypothetical protein SCARR_03884 [Pontiella sulfatireligans]|uniref:Uncharacterized protein n=1 Tax=Pontiella sulfatireligans TaxID=2750658 RepID=A0A6C2URF3_9BACT|nr:hypothetical protein SCARR_03884 [Pontiella sulfatireligans]